VGKQLDLRRRQDQRDGLILSSGLGQFLLGMGLRETEKHRDRDCGGRDSAGKPRHPWHPDSGAARPGVGLDLGRKLADVRGGVSTWARSSGGGSVAVAKASEVATSRNPRTSLAQDGHRFRCR